MIEAEAVALIIRHLEGQFPKTCSNCQRHFETLQDFMANAKPIGDFVSYDLEMGNLDPADSLGSMAVSNCSCGTTLALTSEGMPPSQLRSLLLWAQGEMSQNDNYQQKFLQNLRWIVRAAVLWEPPH